MQALSIDEMRQFEAEGFFEGLACGLSIGWFAFGIVSPNPLSKLTLVYRAGMAMAMCGIALF